MPRFIKDFIKALKNLPWWLTVIMIVCFVLGIVNITWEFNNPKANGMTFLTHFGDVIQFKKVDQFQ